MQKPTVPTGAPVPDYQSWSIFLADPGVTMAQRNCVIVPPIPASFAMYAPAIDVPCSRLSFQGTSRATRNVDNAHRLEGRSTEWGSHRDNDENSNLPQECSGCNRRH